MIARWLFRRGIRALSSEPECAERDLLRALAVRANCPEAWLNLGNALLAQGDAEAARGCFYRARTLAPVSPEPLINAAMAELTLGNMETGWQLYEYRYALPDFIERNGLKGGDRSKMWQGEMLQGKTILVFNEQGAGDTIMGLRYEYALRREYLPERIIFRVPSSLYRIAKSSMRHLDWVQVVTDMERTPEYDALVPFLSLPYRCGMISGARYLFVYAGAPTFTFDPPLTGLKVGIVWAGSKWHKGDHKRSIPLALWEPLLDVRGVSFVSLQAGERAHEAKQFPQLRTIPHPVDFYDTARVMQSLDLVISVDSAPAHLAGALGVPVWTLLPFVPDFRWQLGTESTAWYRSMTLIRQASRGDWAGVMRRTQGKLALLSQQRSAA